MCTKKEKEDDKSSAPGVNSGVQNKAAMKQGGVAQWREFIPARLNLPVPSRLPRRSASCTDLNRLCHGPGDEGRMGGTRKEVMMERRKKGGTQGRMEGGRMMKKDGGMKARAEEQKQKGRQAND